MYSQLMVEKVTTCPSETIIFAKHGTRGFVHPNGKFQDFGWGGCLPLLHLLQVGQLAGDWGSQHGTRTIGKIKGKKEKEKEKEIISFG